MEEVEPQVSLADKGFSARDPLGGLVIRMIEDFFWKAIV